MIITDSQIHIITEHTERRPWEHGGGTLHGWTEFGMDRVLAEMDAAGVDRAILVPTSTEGDRNDTSLAAAAARPDRFGVVGRLDLTAPESRKALPSWLDQPGMLGLRVTFHRGASARWLDDGTADWLWPAAETAGIPLYVHVPGQTHRLRPIAIRHPRLRLVVDHLGTTASTVPDEVPQAIRDLVGLADLPNVAVKASAVPNLYPEPYPFPSTHDLLRRVFDAFGPLRIFWGSDLTRLRCTYTQCVALFTEELDFLAGDDLEWVMGRALEEWLDRNQFH